MQLGYDFWMRWAKCILLELAIPKVTVITHVRVAAQLAALVFLNARQVMTKELFSFLLQYANTSGEPAAVIGSG